ncbi:hypothetical protein GCM10011391_18160 [Pullulanibacillus camelliae]|uniref:Uncharacterized protein n=1 Tax=Pullulanibacillus camelliae TaxID=1707096 RepID=A0A8J2YDE5_9BACL|nr:hypothetical protein [Pullulanibacillus camelliae]GGE39700.1 hypothetical protein GCM10011391_18160 [Pullulanibacillus camelliae]
MTLKWPALEEYIATFMNREHVPGLAIAKQRMARSFIKKASAIVI